MTWLHLSLCTILGAGVLVLGGQKIEAIKQYRAMHGVGLKEAKDAVDARARELGT